MTVKVPRSDLFGWFRAQLSFQRLVLEIVGSTTVTEESGLEGQVATQNPESGEVPIGSSIQVTIGTLGPEGTTPPPAP